MQVNYRSYYKMQLELRKRKAKLYIYLKVKGEDIKKDITFFQYLKDQKQLRYLSDQDFGEVRLYDINEEDFEITDYFIANVS